MTTLARPEPSDRTVAARPFGASDRVPAWVRRGLMVAAAIALLPQAQRLWTAAVVPSSTPTGQLGHGLLLLVSLAGFGVLLTVAVLAGGTATDRGARRLDLVLLVTGIVLLLSRVVLVHGVNDEGALTARAAHALATGAPVYGVDWPGVFAHQPLTKTMSGGGDLQYGYPPLAVLLTTAVAVVVKSTTGSAALVTLAALLVSTVLLWRSVDAIWRPVVVIVLLALDSIAVSAVGGSPVLVAIALLLPVVLRIDRTGAGGRLGRSGLARAAAFGAACAAQQLAWFVAPFIVVVVYTMRVREVGHRAAALLMARYLAVAAAVWLLIDLPFIASQPAAWLQGILIPLNQHAIVHGQSFVDIPYLLTGGSGAIDLFSAASLALLGAFLVAVLLFPGRFGPAFLILPVGVFLIATRGDFAYWMQFSPLWLAAAATVPLAAFRRAWRPRRIGRLMLRPWMVAVLLLPAVVLAGVAALSPPPLQLRIDAAQAVPGHPKLIEQLRITAINTSGHAVTPHFAEEVTGGTSPWFQVVQGPTTLQPGAEAVYVIQPLHQRAMLVGGTRLIAVSDRPMTISAVTIPAVLPGP